jgi:hypothetical protein
MKNQGKNILERMKRDSRTDVSDNLFTIYYFFYKIDFKNKLNVRFFNIENQNPNFLKLI